ncbi:hypothetical protein DERP_011403 [Dermatophagoides pteronyssinus]|uniref:Uncharacterized protein n=1 Tax=Dermatophagoides pteronyssinus TaxID=6956 RepID=A0ABQ8J597_DERPT|nr:hypothetical protein DERP_011403 [Dermatophagoides pteronyssinus]
MALFGVFIFELWLNVKTGELKLEKGEMKCTVDFLEWKSFLNLIMFTEEEKDHDDGEDDDEKDKV